MYRTQYPETYKKEYRDFFQGILRFFELAIFVNNETTVQRLESEINKRLTLVIPFIRIHTVGEHNIIKIEETVDQLNLKKRYQTEVTSYKTGIGTMGFIFEIRPQERIFT
jgi:hypothetical protein